MNREGEPRIIEVKHTDDPVGLSARAARFLDAMRRLGLLDDAPFAEKPGSDWPEISAVLADPVRPELVRHIPRQYHTAFDVLDCALSLATRFSGAAGGRDEAPEYRRPAELLIRRLRYRLDLLHRGGAGTFAHGRRLLRIGLTALVRTMVQIGPPLNRKLYRFLRLGKHVPRLPHDEMFQLLPDNAERLALLNFLHREGRFEAERLLRTYRRHFDDKQLRFAPDGQGFSLSGPVAAAFSPQAKYAAALLKSTDKWSAALNRA